MLSFYVEGLTVNINVEENGIYMFSPFSGEGKTWLFNSLVKAKKINAETDGFTYDYLLEHKRDVNKFINEVKCKVVMFDRFDMYSSEVDKNSLKCLGDNSIVFIDSKEFEWYSGYNHCTIILEKESINVYA